MAEIIQGELTVVHKLEAKQPTDSGKPTEANSNATNYDDDNVGSSVEKVAEKGTKKILGMTSLKRRLANYTISAMERQMNNSFDSRLFVESIYGDRRTVRKVQNQKTKANMLTSSLKADVGAGITSIALGNPAIFALHLTNRIFNLAGDMMNRIEERSRFEEKSRIELYESNKRRERVIVGTFNRR